MSVAVKIQGPNIFKYPVQNPPELRFDAAEFDAEVERLMRKYGVRKLEAEVTG